MKAFRFLVLFVAGIVMVFASQSSVAHASGISPNGSSLAQADVAPIKKLVNVHLVFTVGISTWNDREIGDAYNRAQMAVNYWNNQGAVPVQFQIADTSVAALGFDTLNIEQSTYLADLQSNVPMTVYLVRDPRNWYANGFARPGKYAVVAYSGRMAGDLAHELGHTIGALDHYYWNGFWACTTQNDIMCSGSMATTLSQQTLNEIKSAGW